MLEKQVIVMEPENHFFEDNQGLLIEKPKKKVCAYARVSTDSDDQLNSYQAQIREFTRKIKENEEWDFLGMYADEGISGTSMKKRAGFLRMIEDAKAGKVDLILTKSLSRFARNTVDCLTVVRELRSFNVEVFFEKENLSSSDTKIDFMLTIFSSIAQEEARNISENVKWGFRKRFKEGLVHINTSRFLGYDKDENGKIIINYNQAKTVKMIFGMYIAGSSLKEIANFLTENEITNGRDVVFWTPATVSTILINEKYCGDAILQKRVTLDYLTHKSVRNTGQAPKYYIKNNHEPIIPRKKFELVQELKKKRSKKRNTSTYGNKYPLSGAVYCGQCGKIMNRHYYNYGKPTQRIVLSCKNRYKDPHVCDNKPIDNDTLELAVIESIKRLNLDNPNILGETLTLVRSSLDSTHIEMEAKEIQEQIKIIEQSIKDIININVDSIAENTDFYKEIYNEKKSELIELKATLQNKKSLLVDHHLHDERIQQISDFLEGYTALNKNILLGVYKAIIAINKNEALLVMSDAKLTKTEIQTNIEIYKTLKPIETRLFVNPDTNRSITYHVIKLGGKENECN
ncbi:MAG: recombinase family protein [Tenericutes bacterium]|nr:recombinase family protein [Mycoplasmatota bacterium]